MLHQRTRPSTYPLQVCYAAYFVQINKFRICNDYTKYIYLPHEQISRHIEWHLAILLQWLQADDMGRTLWLIIVLKLFVIFVILRFCFFRPAMQGLSNDEKSERVGQQLQQK